MLQGVDVHLEFRSAQSQPHRHRADLHEIWTAGEHLPLVHPDDVSLELIRYLRRPILLADDVPATDVDLVLEDEGDGLTDDCLIERSVIGRDPGDPAAPPGGEHSDWLTGSDSSPDDGAGIAPEVVVGPVDPLHRHPEGTISGLVLHLHGLEIAEQGGAVVPGCL